MLSITKKQVAKLAESISGLKPRNQQITANPGSCATSREVKSAARGEVKSGVD
jgi:hypothetical protein